MRKVHQYLHKEKSHIAMGAPSALEFPPGGGEGDPLASLHFLKPVSSLLCPKDSLNDSCKTCYKYGELW